MKRKSVLFIFVFFTLIAQAVRVNVQNAVDFVQPLMGSDSDHELSTGNTYPAIAMPWGMNFWVPQTGKMGDGWQYTYAAKKIRGLKQTHQPSPWINDYGQFSLMPIVGKPVFDEEQRASWFSHKAEKATPYYYSVYLADYDVTAELCPTERAALMSFTFPQTDSAHVVVDAFDKGSFIKVFPKERKVVGFSTRNSGGVPENFRNYFVIEFDHDFEAFVNVKDGQYQGMVQGGYQETYQQEGNHVGTIISFKIRQRGEKVVARVASSFISESQAWQNLQELGQADMQQLCQQGRNRWNEVLGKIEVEDEDIDHLRTFYSCLYRSVLFPRAFYEKNAAGEVVHYSPYNGTVQKGYMFTDTGFWDTFRCLFPLLNLMYPSVNEKIQAGLANTYLESGFLPEWASPGHRGCMVGNNSASVVADAYLSGLRGYDAETLWQAVVHGANAVHPEVNSTGRHGFEYYNKLGYVPYDVKINESVARTLEYAYDDWCIYQFGKALGKLKKELKPFAKRAMNYEKVFDRESGLMRGRLLNGKFQSPFNPLKWGDAFTEGNAWQYTWLVPHDVYGLVKLFGNEQKFVTKLDSLFIVTGNMGDNASPDISGLIGQYAHGNEPSHQVLYMYNYVGQPWKAARLIRQTMNEMYKDDFDGLSGNEDVGQMSAWYILSAMGLYQVEPAGGKYIIGSPIMDKATISLGDGKNFSIICKNNSSENIYVQSAKLNGKTYTKSYIMYQDMMKGGTLELQMGNQPSKWGTRGADRP